MCRVVDTLESLKQRRKRKREEIHFHMLRGRKNTLSSQAFVELAEARATAGLDDSGDDSASAAGGVAVPSRPTTQITVNVRKRPKILPKEVNENDIIRCDQPIGDVASDSDENSMPLAAVFSTITVYAPKVRVDLTPVIEPTTFGFDNVFDEKASNIDVYRSSALPLLDVVRRGGSAVVFAFGQTGSGKTFTMLGKDGGEPGIYTLAVADLLQMNTSLKMTASFYEVYGTKLYDLLNDREEVKVLQDEYRNIHIVGLRERAVDNSEDLTELMEAGHALRACGTTHANDRSSRSHAVLVLNMKTPKEGVLFGKMTFVDLAGSERASDTTDTDKKTRREGAEINKSLLALKECIRAMGMRKRHIPFRGSKLTQILRDSFIGNCHTCVIANISPCQAHCEDTLNTLRYADRIKELKGGDVSDAEAPIPCNNCGLPIFIGDRHVCRRIVVQCQYCRAEMDKEKLEGHLVECKEAPSQCPHCSSRVLQGDTMKHKQKCPKWPVRCTLCGENVPRDMLLKHPETQCPMTKTSCKYCRGQFLRGELQQHAEACASQSTVCPHCAMPVKKGKLELHLAECTSNPSRGSALARQPSLERKGSATRSMSPASVSVPPLQPLKLVKKPSGGSRIAMTNYTNGVMPLPSPPPSVLPRLGSARLRRNQAVQGNTSNCRFCGRVVQPAAMDLHIKLECLYAPVACSFSQYGCEHVATKMKLSHHMMENVAMHLALVQRYATQLELENARLKELLNKNDIPVTDAATPPSVLSTPPAKPIGMGTQRYPHSPAARRLSSAPAARRVHEHSPTPSQASNNNRSNRGDPEPMEVTSRSTSVASSQRSGESSEREMSRSNSRRSQSKDDW